MKLNCKVTNINAVLVGASQVRLSATVDIGDGKTHTAELIVSTTDAAVVGEFSLGEAVELLQS